MNSYKLTVESGFHGPNLCESFVQISEGDNVRRLKQRRSRYCLDYSSRNSHVCGCGFPCANSIWHVYDAAGNEVKNAEVSVCECGRDGDVYGNGYLSINLVIKPNEEA